MISVDMNARESAAATEFADALRGKDCPSPELFLTDAWSAIDAATRMQLQTHITSCVACQVERRLANAYDDEEEVSAQVHALALRVRLPAQEAPDNGPARTTPWRGLLAATVAACAIGLGTIVMRNDGSLPSLPQRDNSAQVMRGALIQLLPQASASSAQASMIAWTAVEGSAQYLVSVRNAAADAVWTGETQKTRISLPDELIQTGGKLRWDVAAFNSRGERLAQSAEGVYISEGGGEP